MPGWLKVPGNYACVTADWVKKGLDKKMPMVLVDSRPKRPKYDKGHISTAISLPDSQFDKLSNTLPQDKKALLVFYCGGYKCKLSHKSAKRALKQGYTNVKVFSGGYPEWKKVAGVKAAKPAPKATDVKAGKEEGSIAIASFETILKDNPQSIMLIDVRDADEYATGHFKTAVNIPTDDLEKKIPSLPVDKPIVFVCSTGARSGEAYYMVQDSRPKMKNVFYVEAEITYDKDGSYKIKANE